MGKDDKLPGKVTRSNSKTAEDGTSLATRLMKTYTYYTNQSKLVMDQASNAETLEKWSEGEVLERRDRLRRFHDSLDGIHMEAMCDLDDETQKNFEGYEEMNDKIIATLVKLSDHATSIAKKDNPKANAAIDKDKIRIEVQQTDSSGNIQNVWGPFDGDYSKWRTFHDKWVAHMHNNEKVKPVTKLQNLQAACIGDAKAALGEWDLTGDNYQRAWDRLLSIYEDEYMQVQSFMQKLANLPQIKSSASRTYREIIDAIHKYIHGLKGCIEMPEAHHHAVFFVIAKMDAATYRAWEKHRPLLAKADADRRVEQADVNTPNGEQAIAANRPRKYIPKWSELESFLESEINILMHAERREG
ncbi:MAG: DUF1759 domain-containing protein, partial [Sphingobacteriaceae bacterium]